MKNFAPLLSLPACLITLTYSYQVEANEKPWPYNLPRSVKYYPEHEGHIRRGLEAQERLAWEDPIAMKKMGDDAGEKFLLDYWQWEVEEQGSLSLGNFGAGTKEYSNASLVAAVMPHCNNNGRKLGLFKRNIFAREFECPSGTKSCNSIGSDLCCNTSDSCVETSEGIGCCPSGAACGTDVAGCDTSAGFSSCPQGVGCCIPGAECLDNGCVFYGTDTITATSVMTTTARPQSSSRVDPSTTVSVYTTTATVTISGEDRTETTTFVSPTTVIIEPSSSSCTSDFFSCASSLGGGCCRDGQVCADDGCMDNTSSPTSATAAPPVRPTTSGTSVSAAESPITTIIGSSQTPAGCPTGFYMCSAVYLGGCCRVDRNCDTTSCPASETTAVATGPGVSVGVAGRPSGGSCASGWSSCAASEGGGCCPTGYSCGASCIATVSGAGDTSKIAPESAATLEKVLKVGFLSMAILAGFGMVLL
ncbi:uncharacterized protein RCC_10350 [Ramularia collo-cygni]|uniref:GPI anchored protein n=1 Tax=Ramularia collo-cygni TaxID=112498 RepID=A0A2D3VFG7_9PEZI|nr:uncharacterized protein RCC_10350 [Ramularia collo-cygni]CZT24625.1 uncharacterized protein RCC_10350 [Ramularia collo-cygni]